MLITQNSAEQAKYYESSRGAVAQLVERCNQLSDGKKDVSSIPGRGIGVRRKILATPSGDGPDINKRGLVTQREKYT